MPAGSTALGIGDTWKLQVGGPTLGTTYTIVVQQRVSATQAKFKINNTDVTITDLVTLASIVTRVPPSAREVDPRIWERFLGLALDGLRPGAASVLPRAPLPARL